MERIKNILTDASLFRRCYIYCLFFCMISFVQVIAYAVYAVLFFWGVFLLFYSEKKRKAVSKIRYGMWLVLYMIFSTVTVLLHIKSNFLYNVIAQFHTAICFFIYYSLHTEKHLNFRKELFYVSRFIIYATTIVGVIGLACLMAGIGFQVLSFQLIVYENRFTGIYANPNPLGFMSVVGILSVHMMTKSYFVEMSGLAPISRAWLASAFLVNGVSLFLSDSNGAMIFLVMYVGVFVLYKMFGAEHEYTKKQIILRFIGCALVGVVIVCSVFLVKEFCQSGFTEILESADSASQRFDNEAVNEVIDKVTFDHVNTNIDSGRFRLWRQAEALFYDNPVFGIGKGNVYTYGLQKFDKGIEFSDTYGDLLGSILVDFHNGYFTILVCAGAVGFVLFMIFGIRLLSRITKHLFRDKNLRNSILPCLFAFVIAYLVYAFVEESFLYALSFRIQYFWLILGYIACFICKYEPDHNESFKLFGRKINKKLF